MIAEVFLDTNVLIYAGSAAPADAAKRRAAQKLIENTRFGLSAQVLQEYIFSALRKKWLGISEANISTTLELAGKVTVLPITLPLILIAMDIRRRHQVSHRDSTIIAAAQELGCKTLYSEDLSDAQHYDGVKVLNPFRAL
ncbi:MAG: PIN domain-containing protein [Terrimicrobiaceae bacterium]